METSKKIKENALRRKLNRMGYRLGRSRTRDPDAIDYDRYWIIDLETNVVVAGAGAIGRHSMSLEEVEEWIRS